MHPCPLNAPIDQFPTLAHRHVLPHLIKHALLERVVSDALAAEVVGGRLVLGLHPQVHLCLGLESNESRIFCYVKVTAYLWIMDTME